VRITQLIIYPIKSLGGISLQVSEVTTRGLKYDRRYMLLDANGNMLTQREESRLALFQLSLHQLGFQVTYQQSTLVVPFSIEGEVIHTKVWDDEVTAVVAPESYNSWFSHCLQHEVKLVFMPDDSHRLINPKYASNNEIVSLADGYPVLMISEASLQMLNSKLKEPIHMNRFRPNIVINGVDAHEEDKLGTFTLGSVLFKVAKPCARCVVVTINPETLEQGKEPLATLAKYRRVDDKVNFGVNLICLAEGFVKLSV
jgi:uncharacterized protein YcbX